MFRIQERDIIAKGYQKLDIQLLQLRKQQIIHNSNKTQRVNLRKTLID